MIRKIIVLILLLLVGISRVIYCISMEEINNFYYHFDDQSILKIYDQYSASHSKTAQDYAVLAKICQYLSIIESAQKNAKTEKSFNYALESIHYAEQKILLASPLDRDDADIYYIMARMYDQLIIDAKTGMQYDSLKQESIKKCLNLDSNHLLANLLLANKLLYTPIAYGGDPVKGYTLLQNLDRQYPENSDIQLEIARYYRSKNDNQQAIALFQKILTVFPDHLIAKNGLFELQIEQKNCIIKTIIIDGAPKTSKSILNATLTPFYGQKYSADLKKNLLDRFKSISSITNLQITIEPINEQEIVLHLSIQENNLQLLSILGGTSLSYNYDRKIQFFNGEAFSYPFFSATYIDKNFMGLSDHCLFEISGPHLHTEYFHQDNLDYLFYGETLFIPESKLFYDNGHLIDGLTIQSPYTIADIGIGKKFPFQLSIFWHNRLIWYNWRRHDTYSDPNLIVPQFNLTYSTRLHIEMNTLLFLDRTWLLDGYKIDFSPEIIYENSHSSWGIPNQLIEHNSNPGIKCSMKAGLYKKIFTNHQIRIESSFFTGSNVYKTELWKTGKPVISDPFDRGLNGFYRNEFQFNTGFLGSLYYSMPFISSLSRAYVEYDLFYLSDDDRLFHGAAVGFLARLPQDIELTTQLGVGLNAKRSDGYGLEFDICFTKNFIL